MSSQASAETAAATADQSGDDKKKKGASLARKVSRVTVELPPKNLSEIQKPNHSL